MVSKAKEFINRFMTVGSSKVKIIVAIGLIGMVLILASDMMQSNNTESQAESDEKINYQQYTESLENELTEIISSINGVGECRVMITLENTMESVYATDVEIKNNDAATDQKDEYVIYDSENGETPVLIKEFLPKVQGVTVVCSGGEDTAVKENIIEAVTSLFNIPANRVSVSKINN